MSSSPGQHSASSWKSVSPFTFYYEPNDGPGLLDCDSDYDSGQEGSVEVLDAPENKQVDNRSDVEDGGPVEHESDAASTYPNEKDIPQPKVTIRIPAYGRGKPKRKHHTDTESETDEKPKQDKKHKGSKKQRPYISDDDTPVRKRGRPHKELDGDSDDELPIISRKRSRGRPRKNKENQPPKGFNVAVVIEVAQPPIYVKGRTYKGNKWVKQEPLKLGPFQFSESMSWSEFLKHVGKTAYITEHQMVLSGMTWRTNKSASSALPLTGPEGYQIMVQQLLAMKEPSSSVLIIGHPVPKEDSPEREIPPWARKGGAGNPSQADEGEFAEDSMMGRKLSLDQQLAPIVEKLQNKYPIGLCDEHSDIRCFYFAPKSWHFELDSTKLKVWANAILRKDTNFDKIPLGSNFFAAQNRIGYKREALQDKGLCTPRQPSNSPWMTGPPGSPAGYPANYPQMPHYSQHTPTPSPYYAYGSPRLWAYHMRPPQLPHTSVHQQLYTHPTITEAHAAEYVAQPLITQSGPSVNPASVVLSHTSAAQPPISSATAVIQHDTVTVQTDGQTNNGLGVDQLSKALGLTEQQRANLAHFLAASGMN